MSHENALRKRLTKMSYENAPVNVPHVFHVNKGCLKQYLPRKTYFYPQKWNCIKRFWILSHTTLFWILSRLDEVGLHSRNTTMNIFINIPDKCDQKKVAKCL